MMGLGLGLGLSNQPGAVAAAPGGELLVNGGFDSGANWTVTSGSISAGKVSWPEGGVADQTLVGGSVPAGDYVGVIDISVNSAGVGVVLLGAGGENRGFENFTSGTTGTGLPVTITASGEVTTYRVSATDLATVDNVSLQAA